MFTQMAVQSTGVSSLLLRRKHVLHFEWQYQHKEREGKLVKKRHSIIIPSIQLAI
jgi:hypothetical protein